MTTYLPIWAWALETSLSKIQWGIFFSVPSYWVFHVSERRDFINLHCFSFHCWNEIRNFEKPKIGKTKNLRKYFPKNKFWEIFMRVLFQKIIFLEKKPFKIVGIFLLVTKSRKLKKWCFVFQETFFEVSTQQMKSQKFFKLHFNPYSRLKIWKK